MTTSVILTGCGECIVCCRRRPVKSCGDLQRSQVNHGADTSRRNDRFTPVFVLWEKIRAPGGNLCVHEEFMCLYELLNYPQGTECIH